MGCPYTSHDSCFRRLDVQRKSDREKPEDLQRGDGLLSWSITTSVDWLSVDQSSGTNEAGYLNLTNVRVVVNRTGLADDTYLGELYVTSNGGARHTM